MPSRTVQFRDINSIMDVYESNDIPAFMIFSGSQMHMGYEGDDMTEGTAALSKLLTLMFNSKTAGIYTVCFYKKVPADGINNKTPYNASLNFCLTDEITGYGTRNYQQEQEGVTALRSEVAALKTLMEKFMEGDLEEEEPEPKLSDTIGDILKQPYAQAILIPLAQRIGSFLNPSYKAISGVQTPAGVGADQKIRRQ